MLKTTREDEGIHLAVPNVSLKEAFSLPSPVLGEQAIIIAFVYKMPTPINPKFGCFLTKKDQLHKFFFRTDGCSFSESGACVMSNEW